MHTNIYFHMSVCVCVSVCVHMYVFIYRPKYIFFKFKNIFDLCTEKEKKEII